jgi:hypothetical protein
MDPYLIRQAGRLDAELTEQVGKGLDHRAGEAGIVQTGHGDQ